MIPTADIACAVTLPGIRSLAPILLMKDGTYRTDPRLTRAEEHLARRWIDTRGDTFKADINDLLEERGHSESIPLGEASTGVTDRAVTH